MGFGLQRERLLPVRTPSNPLICVCICSRSGSWAPDIQSAAVRMQRVSRRIHLTDARSRSLVLCPLNAHESWEKRCCILGFACSMFCVFVSI